LKMLSVRGEDLARIASDLRDRIIDAAGDRCKVTVVERNDVVGGGAFPEKVLKGAAIKIQSSYLSEQKIFELLLANNPPVVGVTEKGAVFLHLRTFFDDDMDAVVEAMKVIFHD